MNRYEWYISDGESGSWHQAYSIFDVYREFKEFEAMYIDVRLELYRNSEVPPYCTPVYLDEEVERGLDRIIAEELE